MPQNCDNSRSCALVLRHFAVAFTALTLVACANKTPGEPLQFSSSIHPLAYVKQATDDSANSKTADSGDTLEPLNRGIFKFNEVVDGVLLKPLAHIYRGVMPEFGQKTVKNILNNLSAPVVLLNSVLQSDFDNAGKTLGRFAINSTAGIAGAFDVASEIGIQKERSKDFGQTLGVYGVGTGPYLVLPFIGPSNARDTVGFVADIASDPFTYIFTRSESFARAGTEAVVKRGDYIKLTDQIYRQSLDPYSTFRSVVSQNRERFIRNYRGNE